MSQNMVYCLQASSRWLQLPNNSSQQWVNIALVINPLWNLVMRELCDRRHATCHVWCIIYLCTWTPGIEEQDKVNPRRLSEGQAVSANRCIRGRADGQGQCVSGGAGDCSAPAGNVNNSRQTKDSPGSILLRGLGTCMEQDQTVTDYIRVKHFRPGKWKPCFFSETPSKCISDISRISCQAWTPPPGSSFILHNNHFQPRRCTFGASLISGLTCFSCWKAPLPVEAASWPYLVLQVSPNTTRELFTDIRKIPYFWGLRWDIFTADQQNQTSKEMRNHFGNPIWVRKKEHLFLQCSLKRWLPAGRTRSEGTVWWRMLDLFLWSSGLCRWDPCDVPRCCTRTPGHSDRYPELHKEDRVCIN